MMCKIKVYIVFVHTLIRDNWVQQKTFRFGYFKSNLLHRLFFSSVHFKPLLFLARDLQE